jgi:hypothetical protein
VPPNCMWRECRNTVSSRMILIHTLLLAGETSMGTNALVELRSCFDTIFFINVKKPSLQMGFFRTYGMNVSCASYVVRAHRCAVRTSSRVARGPFLAQRSDRRCNDRAVQSYGLEA